MMAKYNQLFFIFLIGLLLSACEPSSKARESQYMSNQQNYTLHLGLQGVQDFLKYTDGEVDSQPAGINFMTLNWNPPNLGKVRVEHGINSLELENIFSVMGSQFSDSLRDGIQVIDIDAGLTREEFVAPEQAYTAYVELIKKINQAGWKQYFYRFDARIAKEDNLKYILDRKEVIDPTHILSFKEWQEVFNKIPTKVFSYQLYSNGILLKFSIDQTAINEKKQEQYMLRYTIQTIRYDERNSISNFDQMNSQELEMAFQKMVEKNKLVRFSQEREAKQKGYKIDENYQDPDVWSYVK
ncbi:hypothetical protein MMP65_17995 [Acinetobacter sp. ANC 3926]|uniref:hypothetical protein n=1 Tax=Acinetobacter TaxID=469 RepID=UPI001F4A2E76|nr:hypothetical protein [Acinetobacter genomosp. 15BJ]MCH7293339.1 hypothetical protein [Acinetobacter genomosp. 15BJ]